MPPPPLLGHLGPGVFVSHSETELQKFYFSSSVIHLMTPLLSLQLFVFPIKSVSAGLSFANVISVITTELTN